jgi:hypothetical protein
MGEDSPEYDSVAWVVAADIAAVAVAAVAAVAAAAAAAAAAEPVVLEDDADRATLGRDF